MNFRLNASIVMKINFIQMILVYYNLNENC